MLLRKEANIDSCPEYAKYFGLIIDEVKVKEGLVYNKEQGNMVRFSRIDDIGNYLKEYSRHILSDEKSPELASHMLVAMVRGLFSSLEFLYVQFPVNALSADVIYPLIWECISHLEMKVITVTANGASCNKKFFHMHKTGTSEEEFVYKTTNIVSQERRPIFFISDVPHQIKTVRNAWANSGSHERSRQLHVRYHNLVQ